MPVRPGSFEYRFSPDALKQARDRLGLSQAKLAARLDLPVNTISRWERGETTPDAHSLAAIYSIAKERGLEPEFFKKGVGMATATKKKPPEPLNGRRVLNGKRTRLVMVWDCQTDELDAEEIYDSWFYMEKFLDIAFPKIDDDWDFKVYANREDGESVKALRDFDSELFSGNADHQIEQDIRRLCGFPSSHLWSEVEPKNTILVFASDYIDHADLLQEASRSGVDVYLWERPQGGETLTKAVKKANVIPWDHPCRVISEDNLSRIGK